MSFPQRLSGLHRKTERVNADGMVLRNSQFKQRRAQARWRLCHPRRREDCRTRRRKEDEKLASAGQSGRIMARAECGGGYAVLIQVLPRSTPHALPKASVLGLIFVT